VGLLVRLAQRGRQEQQGQRAVPREPLALLVLRGRRALLVLLDRVDLLVLLVQRAHLGLLVLRALWASPARLAYPARLVLAVPRGPLAQVAYLDPAAHLAHRGLRESAQRGQPELLESLALRAQLERQG
jgi:hypothetical protein